MKLPTCPLSGEPCLAAKAHTITDITKEGVKSVDLCLNCLPEYVKVDEPKKKLGSMAQEVYDFLNSLTKLHGVSPEVDTSKKEKPPCPKCGMSIKEIAENKKLGCSNCYDYYAKELEPVLKTVQDQVLHVGKSPKRNEPIAEPEDILVRLKRKMKDALRLEDYELAALLRDEIKKIENAPKDKKAENKNPKQEEKTKGTDKND